MDVVFRLGLEVGVGGLCLKTRMGILKSLNVIIKAIVFLMKLNKSAITSTPKLNVIG